LIVHYRAVTGDEGHIVRKKPTRGRVLAENNGGGLPVSVSGGERNRPCHRKREASGVDETYSPPDKTSAQQGLNDIGVEHMRREQDVRSDTVT